MSDVPVDTQRRQELLRSGAGVGEGQAGLMSAWPMVKSMGMDGTARVCEARCG